MEDKLLHPSLVMLQIIPISKGVNEVTFEGKTFSGTKVACTNFVRESLPKIKPDTKMALHG